MEKKFVLSALIGGLIVAVVGGVILYSVSAPQQLAGDFPGGVPPSQLWSGSAATNSVSPISGLPNLALTGWLSAGGTAAANQLAGIYTGTSTISSMTLGPNGSVTSTVAVAITIPSGSVTVGEPCGLVGLTSATQTTPFSMDVNISSVNAGSSTATGTVSFQNGASTSLTLATGTFRYVCGVTAF